MKSDTGIIWQIIFYLNNKNKNVSAIINFPKTSEKMENLSKDKNFLKKQKKIMN